MIPFAGNKM